MSRNFQKTRILASSSSFRIKHANGSCSPQGLLDFFQWTLMKGTRWILLSKSLDKFDEDSKKRFDNILRTNEPLFKAYYLKEDIGQIWTQENKDEAEKQN